jgi:flagellar biogenesis protein FliO
VIDFFTFLLRPAIALAVVVFLFWLWNKHGQKVEAWVKRKFPARGVAGTHRSVNVRESRRLSRKASVVVIDFEGARLLIGISDGVLCTLHSVSVDDAEARNTHIDTETDTVPDPVVPKPAEQIAFSEALKSAALNSLSPFIPKRNKIK